MCCFEFALVASCSGRQNKTRATSLMPDLFKMPNKDPWHSFVVFFARCYSFCVLSGAPCSGLAAGTQTADSAWDSFIACFVLCPRNPLLLCLHCNETFFEVFVGLPALQPQLTQLFNEILWTDGQTKCALATMTGVQSYPSRIMLSLSPCMIKLMHLTLRKFC